MSRTKRYKLKSKVKVHQGPIKNLRECRQTNHSASGECPLDRWKKTGVGQTTCWQVQKSHWELQRITRNAVIASKRSYDDILDEAYHHFCIIQSVSTGLCKSFRHCRCLDSDPHIIGELSDLSQIHTAAWQQLQTCSHSQRTIFSSKNNKEPWSQHRGVINRRK